MNPSLKKDILKFVSDYYPNYVSGMTIEKYALSKLYRASTALHRCREMVNEGKLDVRYSEGHNEYCFKPQCGAQLTSEEILAEAIK